MVGKLLQKYDWMGKYALRFYYVLLINTFIVCLILMYAKVRLYVCVDYSLRDFKIVSCCVCSWSMLDLPNVFPFLCCQATNSNFYATWSDGIGPLGNWNLQLASGILVLSYSMSNFL